MAAVYRDLDAAALEAEYNLRARVPEHVDFLARWAADSAAARRSLPCQLDVRYGAGRLQTLDVFPAANAAAPLLVFVHGGYWRGLDKSDFSYLAPGFVEAGVTFVAVNYDLAPQTSLDDMVVGIQDAMAWIGANARTLGGDGAAVTLAGHSAGAHLAAMAMTRHAVQGAVLLSGVYDLEPVRLAPFINDDLRLDAESARRNSPIHLKPASATPLVVAVGGEESGEFIRQSGDFAAAWAASRAFELPGLHHFAAVDALGDVDGGLFGVVLDLIDGRLSHP
jgi:arylformamidase